MAATQTRIPFSAFTERTQRLLPELDATRLERMTALQRLHVAKAAGQARELTRLREKLGDADPRVLALTAKLDMQQTYHRQLAAEVERASTPVITPDAETWVLHGRVRDEMLGGVAGRTVALFDVKGTKQFASAQTNDAGYFKIEASVAGWEKMASASESKRSAPAAAAPPALFVHILAASKGADHEDARALTPSGGVVNYLEVVLVASAQDGAAGRGRRGK
ncbi:MAG TPA: hypothetical protein VK511_07805 [Gemmatimonadaceae bacterium]|nr:hypothetical protein [Gemmatimonadaceae bacterium]